MNNFHVYEAIGRGKHSTVYKGRKKKTLEYYAVKSVDKSQRTKVIQEVRALHSLDHPNILSFFFCYETSAHLWLVLEYCVGGDLMTLLRQDNRLPEDSIHDFARDLVKALQYLHSKGIIYCDLKPSNILLDENGRIKLCDFGLVRSIAEISKNSLSLLPQAKKGTPCYMAPELFQEGGVHSYASDFWALGCILYECYVGSPPFIGTEFTQLVNSILSDATPPLPDNPTGSFLNLINRLLVKDPSERIQWPELCDHSFWRKKFTPITLPPQPAFNNMLQIYSKSCHSENDTDRSIQQKNPSKHCARESSGVQKHDENNLTSVNYTTPTKNTRTGRKAIIKTPARVDEKKKETSKVVNILRLSRIAKRNLQRENDKQNYRRPFPKTTENNTGVNIENHDMELDFSENPENEAHDESDGSDSCGSPDENISTKHENNEKTVETEVRSEFSVMHLENNVDIPEDVKGSEQVMDNKQVASTPPSVSLHRNAQRFKVGFGKTPDSNISKSSNDLLEVLWHPSDLLVRPVMPNRKSEKNSDAPPILSFDAPPAGDYAKLHPEQVELLNIRIIHSLSATTQLSEKQNTIRYLEMISMNTDAANILINGTIIPLIVKMLRLSKTPSLRVLLASVLGLVIRHSTLIKPDLSSSGIMNALIDGLRDKQDKVRRFCMAALGELLFYISTQTEHNKEADAFASPLKDNRSLSGWQVPNSVIAIVSSILSKGEDDTTQLYALRTIENICSQGGDWASRFTNQNMIANLCYIYKAIGKQESMKLTAGSCLVRLARFSPSCIPSIFDKFTFKDTASSIVKGSSRERQICLNLLCLGMLGSQSIMNFSRHLNSLAEEKQLIPSLLSLIEQGSEVLRAKTPIFIALLCKNSRRWLSHFFCNAKLLFAIDRLAKEKDPFIQHSIETFVELVSTTVPGVIETVRNDVQQMMLSKRHGRISASPSPSRGNSRTTVHLFPVILHLLGSPSFKKKMVTGQVLSHLANVIKLIESPFQGRDDFQMTLLQILESISEDPCLVLVDPKSFSAHFLPSLSVLYRGNKDGDARFLCLKIIFDVMVIFFNDIIPDGLLKDEDAIINDLKSVSDIHFLPLYPFFIEDEDPIPMYAQKLLVMLIEFNYVKVSDILNLKTVSQCFDFLLGDLSTANVNNVKLCLALASAPEMESKILSQLKVVRKIGNLLEFVTTKEMEDFLDPTLSLCKAFILHNVGADNGARYSKEPSLLIDTTMDMHIVIDRQNRVKDISDFSSSTGVFLELIENTNKLVSDLASECVVLLFKAAPRESTMGLLTNLSKLSSIFQSLHIDKFSSNLVLLRLLYSLVISCRQYLSRGMILSISVTDVRRIEAIVSSLKTSNTSSIAKAASLLSLELQRLPRAN